MVGVSIFIAYSCRMSIISRTHKQIAAIFAENILKSVAGKSPRILLRLLRLVYRIGNLMSLPIDSFIFEEFKHHPASVLYPIILLHFSNSSLTPTQLRPFLQSNLEGVTESNPEDMRSSLKSSKSVVEMSVLLSRICSMKTAYLRDTQRDLAQSSSTNPFLLSLTDDWMKRVFPDHSSSLWQSITNVNRSDLRPMLLSILEEQMKRKEEFKDTTVERDQPYHDMLERIDALCAKLSDPEDIKLCHEIKKTLSSYTFKS